MSQRCYKVRIPQEFLPVFIDMYKMYEKLKDNPEATKKGELKMSSRKDMLLEKAKNRTITYDESIELQNMLQQEARNAQAARDFSKFLIIMGILIFLGALIADLFGD